MGEATEVHLVASLQFYLVELLLFWIVYILTLQGTLVMRQMVNLLATSVDTRHEDYSLHCCPPPPPPLRCNLLLRRVSLDLLALRSCWETAASKAYLDLRISRWGSQEPISRNDEKLQSTSVALAAAGAAQL